MFLRRLLAGRRSDAPRLRRRGVLLLGVIAATGCDNARSPGVGATAAAPSSASTARTATGTQPSGGPSNAPLGSAQTSASARSLPNDLPPDLREAWSELVGRDLPPTFAGPKEQRYYARCLPFTRALNEEAAALGRAGQLDGLEQGDPTGPMRAIDAVRSHPPPGTSADDVSWCAEYTLGGLRLELASRIATEAQRTLQALAGAAVAAHARTGKLCPSSTEPVPNDVREVQAKPYTPKPADWDGSTWRCLHFRWLAPTRFQLEVRSTEKSFSLIARGYPLEPGELEEYRLDGQLGPKGIELGEIVGRYLPTE